MSGDTAELRERDAKRVDALKAAKMAGLAGDNGPALELAGIEDGERIAAEAEADAAAMIDAAKTGHELADVLAKLAPADVRPLQTFSGRELPKPVLWMDPRHGGGTVLRVGDVAVIGGAGGVGKSFATLALAVAAASPSPPPGRPGDVPPGEAVGLHVRSGPAVLIGYEDDPVTVAWRAGLIAARSGPLPATVPAGIAIVPDPSPLMEAYYERPGDIRGADGWCALWDGIAGARPVPCDRGPRKRGAVGRQSERRRDRSALRPGAGPRGWPGRLRCRDRRPQHEGCPVRRRTRPRRCRR